MALATRIAVIDRGRVIQVGTPAEIYEFPRSRFIADFIGTTNFFEGTVTAVDSGRIRIHSEEAGGELLVDEPGELSPGQRVWVALRPEKIRLSKEPPAGERINRLMGVVCGARLSRQSLDLPDPHQAGQAADGARQE